jgi:release factor glutamine methyltransferase
MAGVTSLELRLAAIDAARPIALSCSLSTLTQLWQQHVTAQVPLQYLVGSVPWRQFQLQVGPGVLIPRPETELIVDLALEATLGMPELQQGQWVDLGTGSGAIALGLADVLPQAQIYALDCSITALEIAQANAEGHGFSPRIRFLPGDWFAPLDAVPGPWQGIVSNPPYIPKAEIAQLAPQIQLHEPHLALDGGDDGLACLTHLVTHAPRYLCSGGIWLVETMAGQAPWVRSRLEAQGQYQHIQIFADLAGIERFVLAHRR